MRRTAGRIIDTRAGVNPFGGTAPLISVPTTPSDPTKELDMETGLIIAASAAALLLICACTVTLLRRRNKSRG